MSMTLYHVRWCPECEVVRRKLAELNMTYKDVIVPDLRPQRKEVLPPVRSSLTKDFSVFAKTTPLGTTVRNVDGKTEMTPSWKTAMLLLMVLYPMVMLQSKFVAPVIGKLGAQPWLSVWLSQVVSVALMQWWLMPTVSSWCRRWLDPVDGAGLRISCAVPQ